MHYRSIQRDDQNKSSQNKYFTVIVQKAGTKTLRTNSYRDNIISDIIARPAMSFGYEVKGWQCSQNWHQYATKVIAITITDITGE